MLRVVAFLIVVAALAFGMAWLADRPGSLVINWQGHEIETSVFHAIVIMALLIGLSILAWSILLQVWRSPAMIGALFNRRRERRGLDALSAGIIAIGSGDRMQATRYAVQARKALPNAPLTQLLRAQAAELSGDRSTARRIFETMLEDPETEQLGLRGLFLEAEREGEAEAARQFAERALKLNPRLGWPVDALFDIQCRDRDWDGALETLAVARRNGQIEKAVVDRRRAVLLTAQAQALEESDPARAMQLALEAHNLAADLIPAAAIAGRALASRGNTKRSARVIERTWRVAPHPDLALVYAHARIGDSPFDRLQRIKRLAQLNQHSNESPIALATAAMEARDWDLARQVLTGLDEQHTTQRVCTLMARLEGEEHGDKGRVREWLARAAQAPRDPAWTADGVVSETWQPVSPVTGALDACQWRVPVAAMDTSGARGLARKLDDLAGLGSAAEKKSGVMTDEGVLVAARAVKPRVESGATTAAPTGAGVTAVPAAEVVAVKARPEPAAKEKAVQPAVVAPGEMRSAPVLTGAASAGDGKVGPPQREVRSATKPVIPPTAQTYKPPRPPDDPGPEEPAKEPLAEPAAIGAPEAAFVTKRQS